MRSIKKSLRTKMIKKNKMKSLKGNNKEMVRKMKMREKPKKNNQRKKMILILRKQNMIILKNPLILKSLKTIVRPNTSDKN